MAMKNKIFILCLLLIGSVAAVAQKTSNDSVKTESKPATSSTRHASDSVAMVKKYDSLNHQLALYEKFYHYINNKFFPPKYKNIDIEKAIPLADSLSAARDTKFKGIETLSKTKIDSLTLMLKTMDTLRIQNQTFKALLISLMGEEVYPLNEAGLKGSWQVFVH